MILYREEFQLRQGWPILAKALEARVAKPRSKPRYYVNTVNSIIRWMIAS